MLREDLSITEIQEEEGSVYRVVDPVSGESFEFGEKEWFLLERMDEMPQPFDLLRPWACILVQ